MPFGAGAVEIGLLFAAYSLGNVFGEIYWGRRSDVWGRRKVLVITTFLAALSYFAFAFAPTLWAAVAIRVGKAISRSTSPRGLRQRTTPPSQIAVLTLPS